MGELIGGFDWARTCLGPAEGWSAAFKAHVATCLRVPQPLAILAGPEGVVLYNDPCIPLMAARGVSMLGWSARAVWPELADIVSLSQFADQGAGLQPMTVDLGTVPGQGRLSALCLPLMGDAGKVLAVLAVLKLGPQDGAVLPSAPTQLPALRRLAEAMPGQVWTARPDGRVDWMNDRLKAALAADGGEGWPGLVHEDDRSAIARRWAEAVAAGIPYQAEARLRTPEGTYFWHLIHATPIRSANGAVEGWVGSNVNIHARKLAEAEASEARNRIWTLSRVYMLTFDSHGVILHSNPAIERGLGWREPELSGRKLRACIHPQDYVAARQVFERLAKGETIQGFECRCLMKDGHYRVVDWEVVPDGALNHAVGRDITDQRAALRMLAQTWELSPVMKFITGAEGIIVTVNPAWSKVLGWDEAQSRGRMLQDLVMPEDWERLRRHLYDPGAARRGGEISVGMRAREGGRREVVWTHVAEGGLHYGFGRDVTAEHEAAAAAAAASAEREQIWVSANDLLATMTPDGRLRSVNPSWRRLLGYEEARLLAAPLLELVPAADQPAAARALQALRAGRPVRDAEWRILDQAGRAVLVSWSADPLDGAVYVVGRDVSAQREAEELLRQSQKMEAVGQLTGGIAHDFNNLLQGISGSLEVVGKRLQRGQHEGLERFIELAMAAADRAAALTQRLLAFSRRQPLDPKPVSANPLIGSMEMLLRRTLGEAVELRLELQDGLWTTLCDPNQLENAVLNLTINARDAMPDGGWLVIATKNTELDGAGLARPGDIASGAYVCISVADSGLGMDAATLARAFEPFFTTKPLGQGTGLGLSMIYGFARQSGGFLRIESEPGAGTIVRLYLPRCLECDAPTAQVAPEQIAYEATGESVLVVEDDAMVRGLIVEVLGTLGYAALQAQDGPQGLEMLQSRRAIDLLITDIGLPGLNGRQIAEAGRLLRPNLKVLFMTGYAEKAVIQEGGLAPGMEIMAKPFTMDALAARLRGMLGNSA
ncbi:hybrid sensor histidine kinase/response regulator [Acidocella facilis]|uniref:hybrid sensor histidine kinase/response regulator n=1 Tax=Acidocella facilis TaxID=525 RepID=UPI001F2FCF17|nr:PAS domain S-box protein [Acidocella facilis]